MRFYRIIVCCLFLTCHLCFCTEKLELPAIFSKNMVLQAGIEVPVWGNGKAGSTVEILFNGQRKQCKVDTNGYWILSLSPMKSNNTEQVMTITCDDQIIEIKGVVVGEVWLCSGQSNMDCTLGSLKKQYNKPTPIVDEIKDADNQLIRQFYFQRTLAPKGPIKSMKGYWVKVSPKTIDGFSGVGYFFGRELFKQLGKAVGLIKVAYGGTPIESWLPYDVLKNDTRGKQYISEWENKVSSYNKEESMAKYNADLANWEAEKKAAKKEGRVFRRGKPYKNSYLEPSKSSHYPSTMFNAMINPIIPYAMAGVIWYQGESNGGGQAKYYEETFNSMITSWRKLWNQGDFPFYFVQLANHRKQSENSKIHNWARVRDAQRKALELPNTGMAVAIDVGEERDVHPRNKVDVGKRLAYWALNKLYGQTDIVYSGPLFKSVEEVDGKLIIVFKEVGSGLMVGKKPSVWEAVEKSTEKLNQFFIAGSDGEFVPAVANIISADTIEVSAESISHPKYVRFAPSINPKGINLYNKEGLPASPFYTK